MPLGKNETPVVAETSIAVDIASEELMVYIIVVEDVVVAEDMP